LGYLLLAIIILLLYLLWLGAYYSGLPPLAVSLIVIVAAGAIIAQTLLAGGLAAAIACADQIAIAALVAQYDLAIGRPFRYLVFRSDLAIGRSSVSILADEAIREGRLSDAEAIVLGEPSQRPDKERDGPLSALEPLLAEMYATTNMLQSCLLIHVYALRGNKEQALALIDQTQHEAESMWDKEDVTSQEALSEFHTNIGSFLSILGQSERGIELLKRALERRTKIHGAESEQAAKTLNGLGVVQRDAGDLKGAYESLKKSQEILERLGRKSRKILGYVLDSLAATLVEMGRSQEAYALARRAVNTPGAGANERAIRMFTFGKCLEGLKREKEALVFYDRALKAWSKMQGMKHPAVDQCKIRRDQLHVQIDKGRVRH
jgi:tetratricopeptide (TPR) repeat protein